MQLKQVISIHHNRSLSFYMNKITYQTLSKCLLNSKSLSILALLMLLLMVNLQRLHALDLQEAPSKPNILVILTDDQGYADVGFHGSEDIPTPNIDRIAQNGIHFSQAYVTFPVCGPSRAAILTGRHQDRFGASRNPLFAPNDTTMGLPMTEETIGEVLSRANYQSSFIGKWHMGSHYKMYPLQQGFNEFFGFLTGGHRYFPEEWVLRDKSEATNQWDGYSTRLMKNNGRVVESAYLTDALSREGVDFIRRQSNEQPFLLFMSYNAPHTPMQAKEEDLQAFAHIGDLKRRTYAAMVKAVDDGVGELLNTLEEKDMLENTLIFFLTDNGGAINANASSNKPLRAGKSSFYEGGLRVPFAISWPAVLPAGQRFEQPISAMDIMATAVAQAGVEPLKPLDGVDLIPFLTGQQKGSPHPHLFWSNSDREIYVVRSGDLKLIEDKGRITVFDLSANLSEIEKQALPYTESDFGHVKTLLDDWKTKIVPPAYLGLLQDAEYNQLHPDRFSMTNPYEVDPGAPENMEGYELVWSQEFNEDGVPDSAWWSYEQGFVRNQELQWYQPENVSVQDGRLFFQAQREVVENSNYAPNSSNWKKNRAQANYSSASINTRGKFSFKYGLLEVRARIDDRSGSWPAIWTLGVDRRWPEKGEVDLMEFYIKDGVPSILANAAWINQQNRQVVWDGANYPLADFKEQLPDFVDRFHTWQMFWNEDYIKLYLNGQLLNTIEVEQASYADGFNPFRQPHYILLNLAIGANGGDPSQTSFPIDYELDYVRVYKSTQ